MNTDTYKDYMIRAVAANAQIRAFAVTARDLTETARQAHNTSPIATAALGRAMSGALMMADMLKGPRDLLTIQIDGDGPMQGLVVTADNHGHVKGYVKNPDVILPPNAQRHLNVGGAVGHGTLTVIRDMDLKDPYIGQIPLVTGEIAEDLTAYYAQSEQIPSSVGLGVLMNRENTVRRAGGFVVQLMPFAEEDVIARLEENIRSISAVTTILEEESTPEHLLETVLKGFDLQVTSVEDVSFYCNCSRERFERGLVLLGKAELENIIAEGEDVDLTCQFCSRSYRFTPDQIRKILPRTQTGA
ncbi:MAG: Hsp33 family molecular chaperone HslO [Eubacteriales bacterium]|nr:Hsp33 family molecular chaperone HslO [Sarcina sp.]MBR2729340.1 Hsp33 family molecular chaperone HslO [Lachnospiraceae bacterium]MDO4417485.1 Hsp33 family molecular chaperone HslO [Eubacteriales bacterium]